MSSGIFRGDGFRSAVILGCWALLTASLLSRALYEKASLNTLDLILLFGVNSLAGFILADVARAILGYFLSLGTGVTIFYLTATLPVQVGSEIEGSAVEALWLVILLNQLVPVGVMVLFVGSIVGAVLGERYLL